MVRGAQPEVALPFTVYTRVYLVYQAVSLPVNFTGRSFDLAAHVPGWRRGSPAHYPSVDIFLPICGEPIEVLRNTWAGVFELVHAYPGDGPGRSCSTTGPSDGESGEVARSFGFTYVRRPNCGHHKKSGNLDLRLRPHQRRARGHLRRGLPAPPGLPRRDPALPGRPASGSCRPRSTSGSDRTRPGWSGPPGATLEVFYRAVQVSRDRFGSALCVGSNAVYRRAALAAAGGFTEIPYAEDSHTGLDVRYAGYHLVYLPVVLAAGVCPATIDAFMRQQYRWCCGATSLIWTHHMWRVPMPWQCPAALHRRLAVEPDHRAADPRAAADPDHAARVPARRGPAAERDPAHPGA